MHLLQKQYQLKGGQKYRRLYFLSTWFQMMISRYTHSYHKFSTTKKKITYRTGSSKNNKAFILTITVTSQWAPRYLKAPVSPFLLNRLFRRKSNETSKLRITGLCEANPQVIGGPPHKGPVKRKMFLFDDVIMQENIRHVCVITSLCTCMTKASDLAL